MAERDVLEIDGVEIWACERCKVYKALATGTTCQRCDGKGHIYHLIPGTLSAAIQRLGWAAVEFDEADTAWTKAAHKPSGPHDQLKAAEERYDASLEAVNAALAEVRRLRPTPPEGTNG